MYSAYWVKSDLRDPAGAWKGRTKKPDRNQDHPLKKPKSGAAALNFLNTHLQELNVPAVSPASWNKYWTNQHWIRNVLTQVQKYTLPFEESDKVDNKFQCL